MEIKIDCSRCPKKGSCCGVFPMSKDLIEKHKDKIQVKVKETYDTEDGRITLLTEDFACVFLNRENLKCSIYEDRPEVCKLYGNASQLALTCPYFKPNGNPWSQARSKQITREFDKLLDRLSKEKGKFKKV